LVHPPKLPKVKKPVLLQQEGEAKKKTQKKSVMVVSTPGAPRSSANEGEPKQNEMKKKPVAKPPNKLATVAAKTSSSEGEVVSTSGALTIRKKQKTTVIDTKSITKDTSAASTSGAASGSGSPSATMTTPKLPPSVTMTKVKDVSGGIKSQQQAKPTPPKPAVAATLAGGATLTHAKPKSACATNDSSKRAPTVRQQLDEARSKSKSSATKAPATSTKPTGSSTAKLPKQDLTNLIKQFVDAPRNDQAQKLYAAFMKDANNSAQEANGASNKSGGSNSSSSSPSTSAGKQQKPKPQQQQQQQQQKPSQQQEMTPKKKTTEVPKAKNAHLQQQQQQQQQKAAMEKYLNMFSVQVCLNVNERLLIE